jgi:hypothetical protein
MISFSRIGNDEVCSSDSASYREGRYVGTLSTRTSVSFAHATGVGAFPRIWGHRRQEHESSR